MKLLLSKYILLVSCLATALTGCGGGGGGGDDQGFIGAANLTLKVSPGKIDTGDRAMVTIGVSDIHTNGILLKVKYPKALAYVPNTAFLVVGSNEVDIGPNNNVTKDNSSYLVFFIDESDFSGEDSGEVTFELVGNSAVSEGKVEADADVNDPLVNDATEFSVETPEFGAEESADLEVTN